VHFLKSAIIPLNFLLCVSVISNSKFVNNYLLKSIAIILKPAYARLIAKPRPIPPAAPVITTHESFPY
jgi:hypothetical protein